MATQSIEVGSTVRALRNDKRCMEPEHHLVGAVGRVTERRGDGAGEYFAVEFDFRDSVEIDFICEECLEVLHA